ncbi:hypothetical protein HanIR_Chr15g0759531 [Helianthus annuus]|nr:hypothetical protein HanIR_Chr15g0759531 [Helianthus annuus]
MTVFFFLEFLIFYFEIQTQTKGPIRLDRLERPNLDAEDGDGRGRDGLLPAPILDGDGDGPHTH